MAKVSLLLLSILPVVALTGCAPPNIPSSASTHWSVKDGFYWTWHSPVKEGCVSWMAMERWVSVQVLVDRKCSKGREEGYIDGKGLSYFSSEDNLVFRGYWPWTPEIYDRLIIYNKRGNIGNILPCPYVITPTQINAIQLVVKHALTGVNTDGEKRVLSRIKERLAMLADAELSSSQEGCSDEPKSNEGRGIRADPWTAT